jgi:hypothetical protein
MELFWEMMDSWQCMDGRLVSALEAINQDSISGTQEFVENIVEYNSTANAMKNCTHHMI